MDERIEKARGIYERAVFAGDRRGVDDAVLGLDAVDADVALARGRLLHARFLEAGDGVADPNELSLFERAAALYQRLGDTRSEGEALFWIGCFHQVVRRDNAAAVPVLHRSSELVRQAGDMLTLSYVLRHLGIAEHAADHLEAAREYLEQSTTIRRDLAFMPGVAANLVGLGYIAAGQGRRQDSRDLLEQAAETAETAGAQAIVDQVREARTRLPN